MSLFEKNGAEFSLCGKRRYSLWRIWDTDKPLVQFIGLNPSTANVSDDDPTIQSVRRISIHNGFGGFYMTNLFTIISSDPKILRDQNSWGDFLADKEKLFEVKRKCAAIVFAWGNFKEADGRSYEVVREFKHCNPLCIKKNKSGSPVHPLYQKSTSKFQPY